MSVRRSLAWAFSGQILTFVVSFAGSVIVARLLSPHEMGIFAIAMATQGLIGIFVSFGVGAYIVREPNLEQGTLDAAFTVNALLATALSLLLFGVSFAGQQLLGDAGAGRVLRVSALGPLIGLFGFRASVMMQRDMQFKTMSMIAVVGSLITTIGTVLFALAGFSYMSPAYGGLISSIVGTGAYMIAGRRHHSFRVSLGEWRRISVFGLRMMSVSGVSVMGARLSDLVLGRLLGVASLGLYARASNLSNLIYENIYGTATRVVFVQLSRDFRETGELKPTFLRGLQMITAFMWPLLAGLGILSRPAILILYGEKWLPAATPLALLMLAQFFTLCFGMNWELFVLRDETSRQTRYEITRSVIGLVVFSIGCLFSLAGAAAGRAVDSFIGLVFYYRHVRRLAGTEPDEIPAIYRSSLLLTVAAVLPSLALMLVWHWSAHTPVPLVAGAVALGVCLWLAMIVATGHPLRDELEMALRRVTFRFAPD